MNVSEQALRAAVRAAIARHLGAEPPTRVAAAPSSPRPAAAVAAQAAPAIHASHLLLRVAPGADGACVIEPAVTCTHCGYCQSYGH
jgi:hypothetical protein